MKLTWHGVDLNRPEWGPDSHAIAFSLRSLRGRFELHTMVNAFWEDLKFELPPAPARDGQWRRWIDTSRKSPEDITATLEASVPITGVRYPVPSRTVVILYSRVAEGKKQ